jgi:hypothetical protein
MAMTSMLRLSNSGHTMRFLSPQGKENAKAEIEWRNFASRVNAVSNEGLDGLVNQLHKSTLMFGGMACETVVAADGSDIEDVYTILPQSITWELDESTSKWIPYQYHNGKKNNLLEGNFCWIAFDADIGKPTGTLMYESAIQPIDNQLQFFVDTAAVLRRVGYPRNDLSIDREAVLKSAPPNIRNDPKKLEEYLENYFNFIKRILGELGPTDDLIHYDDIKVGNGSASGDNSRTIDLRAYNEMQDPLVLNGLSCLAILCNRTTGITESWGTVQFKIIVQTIQGLQRCSKRLIENIARIWCQVNGYQLTPVFEHNPVDWDTEIKKLEATLKKLELNRRQEEYGYIDTETAALAMGVKQLPTKFIIKLFEYLKKAISPGEPKPNTKTESDEDDEKP